MNNRNEEKATRTKQEPDLKPIVFDVLVRKER